MNPTLDLLRRSWRDYWSLKPRLTTPYWMQWMWTLVIGIAWGLGVPALVLFLSPAKRADLTGLPDFIADNFIVATTIAVLIHLLIEGTTRAMGARYERLSEKQAQTLVTALMVLGVALGWPLGMKLTGVDVVATVQRNPGMLRFVVLLTLVVVTMSWLWFRGEAERLQADNRATEAQLRLLQGQIEPHFLFNTLANVVSLMEADPLRAKRMLETFIDYLRASLGPMRRDGHTLAQELELVQHYLELLQMRMGERLRFSLHIAPEAHAAQLPPLLLQPLVENAVHHGLEPKLEGGQVLVRASVHQGRLRLQVQDDGLGLDAPRRSRGGQGLALHNVRERLQALYGSAASLTLEPAHPGTLATVELPCDIATRSAR